MTRVLLADDHPFILAGVEAVLLGSRYEVVAKVHDGAAVLGELAKTKPDVLILDVRMPGRDGIDVLRALRERGDDHPVILLTASLDDRALLEAIKVGVNGIVLKEGAEEILVECLDAVCGGARWIEKAMLQKALDLSLAGDEAKDPLGLLSTRERAVARLVAQGWRNRDIGDELGITEGTVKVYLHGIYEKLRIANRTELAVLISDARSP